MKIIKIALAAAIVAGTSNIAVANTNYGGNTVSIDTDVLVYVAAGLSVEVTQQLIFSDVVVPAPGQMETGISMDCSSGDVSYKTAASTPNGLAAADGAANANGDKQAHQPGRIKISGEPNYAITVSAATGNGTDGVTLTPLVGNGNSAGPINRSLKANGVKFVSFCGSVDVTEEALTTTSLTVPVTINISYR